MEHIVTNKEKLEKYLQPFLLNNINNEKIIMLSGSWGAGKTYFWQNEIAQFIKSGILI